MRPTDARRAACVALTAVALIPAFLIRMDRRTVTAAPAGLYTAHQILDRTNPFCRILAPEAGDLVVSADRVSGYLDHPYWNVTATDRAHRDVVSLRWSDDTGEIYLASHLET